MKTWKHEAMRGIAIIGIFAIIALTLFACNNSEEEDEGELIINLDGGSGRSVWPPDAEILNEINYEITLSGKWGTIPITAKGGETIRKTVYAGRWNIDVKAYYQDELYAIGNNSVDVKARRNNSVSIQMHSAFEKAVVLVGITAKYSGSAPIYSVTPLHHLKQYLTVMAIYNDGSEIKLDADDYELSGELIAGTLSTITVTYEGETAIFIVDVSSAALVSITVDFAQEDETIYTSTPLDNLKQYLTVTATYDNGDTEDLDADEYTLSGALTAGTPTITVHYGDHSDTFTPAVTAVVLDHIEAVYDDTTTIYETTPLDDLKTYLTVTAFYNDGNDDTLLAHEYTLTTPTGTLIEGENTVTITYIKDGVTKIDTFTVNAVHVHVWGEWTEITTAATCLDTGIGHRYCTECGEQDSDIVIPIDPINGHDWKDDWKQTALPNCTTAGVETDTCNLNAEHTRTRAGAPINPNAHDWNTTTTATASAAGTETGVCRHNSSHTYNRNVLAPMVFVPTGSFQLGKDLGTAATGDTTPVSNVTLSGFFIGKYEVTQSQWQAAVGPWPNNPPVAPFGVGDAYPMYYVMWPDALVFCNRLSIMEGLTPAYRIADSTNPDDWGVPSYNPPWSEATIDSGSTGYRLLTEAQWEYAAKGGNPLAPGWVGYTYAGSDIPGDVARYGTSGPGQGPYQAGTRAPNFLGLYDMSGNVEEWVWEKYGNYTPEDKFDPTGTPTMQYNIRRGGSWSTGVATIRSAYRVLNQGNSNTCGFRIARPAGVPLGNGSGGAIAVTGITAPTWRDGGPVTLTAPQVLNFSGNTASAQGWQISDDGENNWTTFTAATADMSLDGKYLRYYATVGGTTYYSRNTAVISVISPVNNITAIVWREGSPVSLTAPVTGTPTAHGWQISDDGTSSWTNFTPPSTANMSYNGKYLRYYATVGGTTYYSNTVGVTVFASDFEPQVTIDMYDTSDGWNGAAALRIVINGTEFATGVKVQTTADNNTPSGQRTSNTYTFPVEAGDVVQLYWVSGSWQEENSFIAYYTIAPPDPAFTSSNNNSWSGSNALVFRLRGTMNSIANGTLLGSFTVP